jgi:hypothetical protein
MKDFKEAAEKALAIFPKPDMSKITDGTDLSGMQRDAFVLGYSEAMKEQDSKLEAIVQEVINICIEHSDDGHFDYEGAEANALHIIRKKFSSFTEEQSNIPDREQ